MLSNMDARARAVLRAIQTGQMENMDLIHKIQAAEGHFPCFGRQDCHCTEHRCRWHAECMDLTQTTYPQSDGEGR